MRANRPNRLGFVSRCDGFGLPLLVLVDTPGFMPGVLELTIELAILVFCVTLAMCVVSGLLALRKLLSMDPASLF